MPYTLGSTTTGLTGAGQLEVADLVGVRSIVTGVPARIGSRPGTPQDRFGLGHLTPGDANGWDSNLPLQHVEHLFYPLRDGITKLGYSLTPGVTVSLQLLTGELQAGSPDMLDRNPVLVTRGYYGTLGAPNAESTVWTYTVPAGRAFLVTHLNLTLTRLGAASVPQFSHLYVSVPGGMTLACMLSSNAVGAREVNGLAAGPIFLAAGQTIFCQAYSSDTGGSVYANAFMGGTLVDA